MRLLCSFVGGNGHFAPLLPVAKAMRAAGHEVRFAGQRTMVSVVEAAGFACFQTSRDLSGDGVRRPLVAPDAEREDIALRDHFAGSIARSRARDLLSIFDQWRPDLIVCDEADFGATIAAERCGIPHATVLVMASGAFVRPELLCGALNTLRAEFDLPPDPDLEMLHRHLSVSPFPPSFRDPAFPLPSTARSIRPAVFDTPPADAPEWLAHLGEKPVIYFTLGTIFNIESGNLFGRVLDGLRDLDADVIVTVGREIDPAELGPQPANVRIERFIPQAAVLPHLDLVVSHGGSGTVIGALAYGIPQIVIPLGADQMLNAKRVDATGAGRVMDAITLTPADVEQSASEVLEDASCRIAAKRLRDEIAELPDVESVVPELEALVAHHR
jgi:UDP:flavonoid glycosyltransferase YjiC (YdhE family)